MTDWIERDVVLKNLELKYAREGVIKAIGNIPSAFPERLTDKEQRIFLAAMSREEKICKEIDAEMTEEQSEDSLVRTCHEITRKVKKELWTN